MPHFTRVLPLSQLESYILSVTCARVCREAEGKAKVGIREMDRFICGAQLDEHSIGDTLGFVCSTGAHSALTDQSFNDEARRCHPAHVMARGRGTHSTRDFDSLPGNHTAITQQSLTTGKAITQQLHSNHTAIAQQSLGNHSAITQQSHFNHTQHSNRYA